MKVDIHDRIWLQEYWIIEKEYQRYLHMETEWVYYTGNYRNKKDAQNIVIIKTNPLTCNK